MATNDFLAFAGGAGANVLPQAEYQALAALSSGFGSGVLLSENLNKVLRQATVMAAVLGQWIADKSGNNVLDDGTTATIEASFTAALAALGLRAASTSQTGVSQLAISAEAQAFTDALKVLTPATLKGAFQGSNQSLVAAGGYQKLPGGLILQWAQLTTNGTTTKTLTYPIAFPNALFADAALCPDGNLIAGQGATATTRNFTTKTVAGAAAASGVAFTWIGVGN